VQLKIIISADLSVFKKKLISKIIMLKQINEEYFISIDFVHVIEEGKEYLKKDYDILLFNKKNEFSDVDRISIYLIEQDRKWIVSKHLSINSKHKKLFKTYFKNYDIKELMYFDIVHSH